MKKLKSKWIGLLIVIIAQSSCSKEPVSILTFEINNQTYTAGDMYVLCNKRTVSKEGIEVCYKYTVSYKLSEDFSFICTDSSLTNEIFEAPNIEAHYAIQIADSIKEYELFTGHVELDMLERKGELKGSFSFQLVNKDDSTDILYLENGFFHAQLNLSYDYN